MSQRQTRLKPVPLLAIGGTNQRVRDTELSSHEYSLIEGAFPEFAGLQSRVWGKRLLAKYPDSVYGIHQFWTPYGYGGGLYQFDGLLDFGPWLTPTSNFDLTPPLLPFDGGNMTVDDFGDYGGRFGYGTANTCLISAKEEGTIASSCGPGLTYTRLPGDYNGGPGGQGNRCLWQLVEEEQLISDFATLQKSRNYSNVIVNILNRDNCRNDAWVQPPCVNYPSLPQNLEPIPAVGAPIATLLTGVLSAGRSANSFATFAQATNSICFQRTVLDQSNSASNTNITINLKTLFEQGVVSGSAPDIINGIDGPVKPGAYLVMNRTPGGSVEIPLTVSKEDQILNAETYLVMGPRTANNDYGYNQSGSVTGDRIRIRYLRKQCG